jgi:ABC-2 type transport system permease protein
LLLREPAAWLLSSLLFLACTGAIVAGVPRIRAQQIAIAAAAQHEREHRDTVRDTAARLEQAPDPSLPWWKDPRRASLYGANALVSYAESPPGPLSLLTSGQSDLHAPVLRLTTQSAETFVHTYDPHSPLLLLLGRFDLSFALLHLLPLLVIALCYSLLASERARGMLPLLAALPVSLPRLLLVRLVARALLIAATVALALAAGALLASHLAAISLPWPRLAAWLLAAALHALLWLALSAWVVSRGRSADWNALCLGGLWLLSVVLLPALISLLAKTAYPVSSRVQQVLALRAAFDEASQRKSQLLSQLYEDHPELAPKGTQEINYAHVNLVSRQHIEAATANVLRRFEDERAAQRRLVVRLSYLSPTLLTQDLMNRVAGGDDDRQQDFLRQAREHHAALRAFFDPRVLSGVPLRPADFAAVPRFQYREPPLALAALLPGLAVLAVAALLVFALALARPFSAS